MKKEICFEERRRIQLEMLDEIDSFCRINNIRYSIAFGTLLGAIRHKGFIPWDDDVDIMMPLPDLERFKATFRSDNLTYVDIDKDKTYGHLFPRIAHNASYNKDGLISKTYGICIDLYVMIGLPEDSELFFNNLIDNYSMARRLMKFRRRIIKLLPIKNIPLYTKYRKSYKKALYDTISYNQAREYYVIAGPFSLRKKMTYDRDLFKNLIELPFEDRNYLAIGDYDYFLTLRYDDYMQLPPEDQRHPYHGGKYYWKY